MDSNGAYDLEKNSSNIESFPKTRLYPENWDMSELHLIELPDPQSKDLPTWYNPFQELRTIPGGWEL